ncbi:Crp/Fnr family transcriptional regulator [Candidatus Albibeggiatoa sp. nov. BB20]|uniref:Crp/Fnr family transcriptional regulator n=1 Tax=Candidatus Albibeggiatoa sp. nov. BB20 TaxID=3162723 RepID=UPI0033657FEF
MQHNSNAWLAELSEGQTQSYIAGEIISYPDKTANRFFIVQTGQARIFLWADNKELTIGYLRENSLYVTHTRAWIKAMSETQITSWPLSQLKKLMTMRPEFAIEAMQEIGMMLHNTIDIIEDLAFRSVESRFARYLLTEYHQQKSTKINNHRIDR